MAAPWVETIKRLVIGVPPEYGRHQEEASWPYYVIAAVALIAMVASQFVNRPGGG